MRVEVNESEDLKKERKVQFTVYPENERDVETCRELKQKEALSKLLDGLFDVEEEVLYDVRKSN